MIVFFYPPKRFFMSISIIIFGLILFIFLPNSPFWGGFKIILGILIFFFIDWYWKTYMIDNNGIHQRWFFCTNHFKWDDFHTVSVVSTGTFYGHKGTALILDRKEREYKNTFQNYYLRRIFHPFTFIMIELTDQNGKPVPEWWYASKEEMKSYLSSINIMKADYGS